MKLHTDRQEVERSNVATESTFRIKTTAKAFDILSSGLYTDPIRAVIRELSCNAYDAHVAAGNEKQPFEIHLPNRLEPFFGVKDFGTGLSDEDVMNLYSTYFDSTKTESNDFIGALGLGSKSPFSYTNAFEVISRYENVKRIYSVFINEHGVPTIAKMGEVPTDEHNGLEVKITVNQNDFWTFQEKLAHTLRWFPVKPNVVGTSSFQWPDMPKQNLSGHDWALFDKHFADDYSRMTAVQGNVAYKVDISKLDLQDADDSLLSNCHVVGFFNIGDLEVAASREEIRYDARSVAALKKRLKEVRAGILSSVEKRVRELEDNGVIRWGIMIELNKTSQQMFGNRSLFNEFLQPSKNASIQWYLEKGGRLDLPEIKYHNIIAYSVTSSNQNSPSRRTYIGTGVDPDNMTHFFLNDMKVGGIAKITHYLRTLNVIGERRAIVIRRMERPKADEQLQSGAKLDVPLPPIPEEDYQQEFDSLVEALGDVDVKLASTDAPLPPRARNGEFKSLPIFKFERVNQRRYGKATITWERIPFANIDTTKDALYFFIRNGSQIIIHDDKGQEKDVSWETANTRTYLETTLKLINDGQGTTFTLDNVYAVGSLAARKVRKLPNWTNLFDALKTQLTQFTPAVEYFARCEATPDVMGLRDTIQNKRESYHRSHRSELTRRMAKLTKDSQFRATLEPLIAASDKFGNLGEITKLVKRVDLDLGTKIFDNVNTNAFFTDQSFEVYPMLSFVNNFAYLNTKQLNLYFDYIDTIDRS